MCCAGHEGCRGTSAPRSCDSQAIRGGCALAVPRQRQKTLDHSAAPLQNTRQTDLVGSLGLKSDRLLGRSPSTISREILRNAGGKGYVSRFAQQRCRIRRIHSRPQPKLLRSGVLFKQVCEYLRQHWSPQQIAGQLKKLHPHDRRQRVSHESIYTCIYAQPRGELKKELVACLRMAHAKRWPRSKGEDRRGEITDLVSIHVRPPEVEDRQLPGHWEGDLIKGARNASAIGTLVERTTRLLIRPCEVLSRVANVTILEVANNALRVLLQHRHVIIGSLA